MSAWSPEDDAKLHRLWKVEGLSATLCAQQFPGRTRNAIIGRVNRMGINRPQASQPAVKVPYPKRISAPKVQRPSGRGNSFGSRAALGIGQRKTAPGGKLAVDLTPTAIASTNARVWTERKARQCAFPVRGEGADTLSCCNPTDGTYCIGHARVMFAGAPTPNVRGVSQDAKRGRPSEYRMHGDWAA